ncbi:hypothetical protein U1Q18_028151 [Sarracenia purpurea var. burkii]
MAGEVKGSGGFIDGGTTQVAYGVARSSGAVATLVRTGAALVRQEAAMVECKVDVDERLAGGDRWRREGRRR